MRLGGLRRQIESLPSCIWIAPLRGYVYRVLRGVSPFPRVCMCARGSWVPHPMGRWDAGLPVCEALRDKLGCLEAEVGIARLLVFVHRNGIVLRERGHESEPGVGCRRRT